MSYIIYVKAFGALFFVIALIILFAIIAKKFNLAKLANHTTNSRIKIEEIKIIDHNRKLMLAKCDDEEFLLLLGNNDILIKSHKK